MKKFKPIILVGGLTVFAILFLSAVLAVAEEDKFLYNDNQRRDPLWPLVSSTGTIINYDTDFMITDLVLEGIVTGAQGNLAIINGSVVKTRDTIGRFVVQQIDDETVVLTKDSQKFELRLKKED